MMTKTTESTRPTCGFCNTGSHHLCPGGVRNGNGSIYKCLCGCPQSLLMRCTECNTRDQELIGNDWRCKDRDACNAEIEARAAKNPTIVTINTIKARAAERERIERSERRSQTARDNTASTPGAAPRAKRPARAGGPVQCTCGCGGSTKGGRFLPGHDSKYLVALSAHPNQDEALSMAGDVSEAFRSKLARRIGA